MKQVTERSGQISSKELASTTRNNQQLPSLRDNSKTRDEYLDNAVDDDASSRMVNEQLKDIYTNQSNEGMSASFYRGYDALAANTLLQQNLQRDNLHSRDSNQLGDARKNSMTMTNSSAVKLNPLPPRSGDVLPKESRTSSYQRPEGIKKMLTMTKKKTSTQSILKPNGGQLSSRNSDSK